MADELGRALGARETTVQLDAGFAAKDTVARNAVAKELETTAVKTERIDNGRAAGHRRSPDGDKVG